MPLNCWRRRAGEHPASGSSCAGKLPSGTARKRFLAQRRIGSGRAPRAGQCLPRTGLVAARPNPDRHGADRHPGRCFRPAQACSIPAAERPCRPIGDNAIRVASADIFQYFYILNKFFDYRKIIVSLPLRKRRFFHRCLPNGRLARSPAETTLVAHLLGKTLL